MRARARTLWIGWLAAGCAAQAPKATQPEAAGSTTAAPRAADPELIAERGVGDVEETRTAFVASLEQEREAELRGNTSPGHWGVLGRGSFEVSFYYSVPRAFEIRNAVTTNFVLFFPSPRFDALLESARKPKPSKQPKRSDG